MELISPLKEGAMSNLMPMVKEEDLIQGIIGTSSKDIKKK